MRNLFGRRPFKLLHNLFWFAATLAGGAIFLAYILHALLDDQFLPVRLFGFFMPWLLMGLTPIFILALLLRRRAAWILVMPTLVLALTYAPLFLPRLTIALAGNEPLKVMSYNVLHSNQQMNEVVAMIKTEQPDVLVMQEVIPEIALALRLGLKDMYGENEPYHTYEGWMGQLIVSRYPVTPGETNPDKGRLQKVTIETSAGQIDVWNIHPRTPLTWQDQQWQIDNLVQDIKQHQGPLIVAGDLNTTDHSETYQMVERELGNAHWDAGWGFGFTFPSKRPQVRGIPVLVPMVRIDHIFYSDHFYVHRAATLDNNAGSDHLPVIAELSIVR